MRSGYWIVGLFATGWAAAGLLASGYPPAVIMVPVLISGVILAMAYSLPSTGYELGAHTRRLLARWSLIEGVAILVAINVLRWANHPNATFSAVAAIVGLHFLPLAKNIPVRAYYATALGLVVTGGLGMLMPASARPLFVGLGAAGVLWTTALYRLLEARRSDVP